MFLPRRLHDDDEPLGAERGILDSESRDQSLPDSFDLGSGGLNLLRDQVASRLDDEVLRSSRDEDLPSGDEGAVPGVEKPVGRSNGARRLVVPEIALHYRRPAKDEPAFAPFGKILSFIVDDAHVVSRYGPADGNEQKRLESAVLRLPGDPFRLERFPVDSLDADLGAELRCREE